MRGVLALRGRIRDFGERIARRGAIGIDGCGALSCVLARSQLLDRHGDEVGVSHVAGAVVVAPPHCLHRVVHAVDLDNVASATRSRMNRLCASTSPPEDGSGAEVIVAPR